MLDIKVVRANPEKIKQAMKSRNKDMDAIIDDILKIDIERREITTAVEGMKAEQNVVNKQIPMKKKAGEDVTEILATMKTLSDKIKEENAKLNELEEKQQNILLNIPNLPHESVPIGKDENDNVEIRRWSTPTEFAYEPKAHWDIGENLGILDPERAAKVTGARFHFYKGLGAKLERAIIAFYLDTHGDNGYTEIIPPYMANRASMTATGQLPKFEDDAFKIADTEYFLIPTAEVPVTNMHRNEILDGNNLPIKYCTHSACFRAEAGSAGRDTRGLIRQHQFNKVELVKFAKPEQSYDELEGMVSDAERVLQLLGLPYRVILLCSGDMGFSAAKTYDIEVWMPSYGRYCEISSCSNCEDYQARRGAMRYKDDIKSKAQLVHTLNGSGVAVGRTVAAILENYQNDDGTVTIPSVLVKYMNAEKIEKR